LWSRVSRRHVVSVDGFGDCFLRTKMDVLVLGNHVVRRNKASGD